MKKAFMLVVIYITSISALADETCSQKIKSYQDLISCAEIKSPEVQKAQLALEQSKAQIKAAGQWRNPELSAETVEGKVGSENARETEISLAIPIELGGKISARTTFAESSAQVAEANMQAAQFSLRSEMILSSHRLRQVLHEQEIVDESIGAFTKLVNQYKRRPGLSPEQQMSLSVFQLSKGEYDLKKSEIADEILKLESFFKLTVGLGIEQVKEFLPKSISSWPNIANIEFKQLSPRQKVLQAELDAAHAELRSAQSEAWPTLMVGPSYRVQTESGQTNKMVGVNISLPLPLFNFNGEAKNAAKANVRLNETKKQIGKTEQDLKINELINTYNQSVKILKTSIPHDEIEKKHHAMEKLFNKGVVPSSLFIEAHRASFELERTRHERELKALQSLLEIRSIEGTIQEILL